MKCDFKFPNGFVARDVVSGFVGTITGRADYIAGCRQYCLQPDAKDGDFKGAQWFDEERLQCDLEQRGITGVVATPTGGPADAASAAPTR